MKERKLTAVSEGAFGGFQLAQNVLLDQDIDALKDLDIVWLGFPHSDDQARRALSRGDVLPIEEILKHLKSRVPGQVLEVEFEREDARWVYEFKMIDETGRRLEVYLDAKTGDLISVEGR